MRPISIYTGRLWHMMENPWRRQGAELAAHDRGALAVSAAGEILDCGDAKNILNEYPNHTMIDFGDSIIVPGFIDGHLHFPQLEMIGCPGESLLGWLDRYIYPAEIRMADENEARRLAAALAAALPAAGVTCAAIFSSSHLRATEILFEALHAAGLRAIAGKVSMDRNAPAPLLADVDRDIADIEHLIKHWHGRDGRFWVALTPRFAPACTEAMLTAHGELRRRDPSLYVQTHIAENHNEMQWVREIFPNDADYLAVYERFGLVGPRTLLAHCIHFDDVMIKRLAQSGGAAVHCPTSNFFLGSGLAPLARLAQAGARLAAGSDIGAGTSLSAWRTLAAAYEAGRLREEPIGPEGLFWLATLGGAEALYLDHQIGNFAPGKQADFQVIDWQSHPLLKLRMDRAESVQDQLFALIAQGDERLTREVYVAGRRVFPA